MLKYTAREEMYGSKAAGRRVKEQLSLSKTQEKARQAESSGACICKECLIYLSSPTASTRKCLVWNRHLVNECPLNETKKW